MEPRADVPVHLSPEKPLPPVGSVTLPAQGLYIRPRHFPLQESLLDEGWFLDPPFQPFSGTVCHAGLHTGETVVTETIVGVRKLTCTTDQNPLGSLPIQLSATAVFSCDITPCI